MVFKTQVATYLSPLHLFNRQVRMYLFTVALSSFTVDGGIYAVLFNLYLLRLGYSPSFVGAVNAAGLLAFGICSLPAGLLGGRWGSQRMFSAGLGVMVVGCMALPLTAATPPTWQAGWLIGTYVFICMGLAFYTANATPLVMDMTSPAERNSVFSIASALWFLAGFGGNLVGGWLPTLFVASPESPLDRAAPYRNALGVTALFLIPALLAVRSARQVMASALPRQPGKPGAVLSRRVGVLALVRLLQVMGCGSVFIFLTVYLDKGLGAQTSGIGALLAIGRLCAAPAAMLAPRLAVRWDRRRLIIWATGGIALSLMPLAFVPRWEAAMLSFIGVVTLTALRIPAFLVYSMEAVAPTQRSTMSGALEMANGLGFAIVGLAGGYLIAGWGYRPLFFISACLTAVGTLIFWWCCDDWDSKGR